MSTSQLPSITWVAVWTTSRSASIQGATRNSHEWAQSLGKVEAFGIEGTGSYGVGLTSFLRRNGQRIVEVNRGDRRTRRQNGKSDTLDAETAARSVLNGNATSVPKSADGLSEMIRQIKVARDTAGKGRTAAIITLKTIVVNAPAELRESLDGLADKALIDRCAGFRPGRIANTTASAKHTLKALAKRWLDLEAEVKGHDAVLGDLTTQAAPTLCDGFGIGADTAAEMLIVFGDNPGPHPLRGRLRQNLWHSPDAGVIWNDGSTQAVTWWAPASQRCPLQGRHRPHEIPRANHRLRDTKDCRRPHQERHHSMPQAILGQGGLPAGDDRSPSSTGARFRPLNACLDL